MRLHHLAVVAFGPFGDRAEVDFDTLSDAGLFLLTGATGAGKTSVLDAVCFALYGAVPGDRQSAKRLRSDHAAPGVAPRVTLEFSVTGRRFRIARSPSWERPKRRGSGTTRQQASVVLSERVDATWVARATRLDDAGHLVGSLLGMTLTQFCQVQLLPQGRFQAFLRAESDERHRLLQRLFRTSRFEQVEQWLREHRRTLRRQSAVHHDAIRELVSRISEVSGESLPTAWDRHDLDPAADELAPWAAAACEAAVAAADAASRGVRASAVDETATREALQHARGLVALQQRHAAAAAEAVELGRAEPAHQDRVAVLEAARRVGGVLPLCAEADRTRAEAESARAQAERCLGRARDLLGRPGCRVRELEGAVRAATAAAADARAREPHVEELTRLEESAAATDERLAGVERRLHELDGRAAVLPHEITRARAAERAAARAADRLPVARQEIEDLQMRLDAARLVSRLVDDRAAAETALRASVDQAQDAKELWLEIQQLRLEGMAAEIAGALAVGACCPVCGSADHPQPARPAPGAPDVAAERAARKAVDDAEAERHARAMAVTDLDTRIRLAREAAGGRAVPVLEREHAAATRSLDRLHRAAEELPETTRQREALETELSGVLESRIRLVADQARLAATVADHRDRADTLRRELSTLLDDTGHESVAELAAHHDAVAAACTEALAASARLDRAAEAARDAEARALRAAADHGFTSLDDARAATLPAPVREGLERQVRAHEVASARVAATLADPELEAATAEPCPDLDQLQRDHDRAARTLADARTQVSLAARQADRLRGLAGELDAACEAWHPLRAGCELADRIAALADGTSPDNRLRMRLSAYVLGYRLGQVVAAANERLARMFDHRYTLEHSVDRGVGESRGGLSLRVRDDWTGESRDPATLSGGETFVVSLALALGLADVISHEAGGSELDTLFVDEGFGSLDAETLDQVMDTLDSLRDGGRVVGVVSHVPEMRDRIPAQLHVRKHRSGSSVSQGHALR